MPMHTLPNFYHELRIARKSHVVKIPICLLIMWFLFYGFMEFTRFDSGPHVVTLRAREWEHGQIKIWKNLEAGSDVYVVVPQDTYCRMQDKKQYHSEGYPQTWYYFLACDGDSGYVRTDQVYY